MIQLQCLYIHALIVKFGSEIPQKGFSYLQLTDENE